ncbi:MAG: TolC family protein [Verrucomicrobia bacterium]|nr:TolC family protein [Verrucomicrobiota bacterium]
MKRLVAVLGSLIAGAAASSAGPSLEECVRAALAESPQAAAAEARAVAARAAIRQAESALWPVVSVSGGYARTDNPPQAFMMALNQRSLNMQDPAFDPNRPDDTGNARLGLGAKMRLLDFGRRANDRRAAVSAAGAQSEMFAAVRNDLVHEVTRGFYTVLQAQSFVAVQQEQVRSLEESLRVARARMDRGAAVKSDVLSLEVRLAQAQEDLIRARNGVGLAVAALNTAIGRDLVPEAGLDAVPPEQVPDLPADAAPDASGRHPAVRAAEAAVAARRSALARAQADRRPTVSAFGEIGWDSEDFSDAQDSYYAGVMAEWDVFDGFRRSAAIREAEASLAAAEADARRARDGVKLDQRQARLQAREARERWTLMAKSVESADEALRMTKARYEQGAADVPELLNAELGLAAVRSRRVAAVYDYLTALSNIGRAAGELAAADGAK